MPIVEKRRAALILMLILCSILLIIPNIGTVKASETIYIRADGTVEGTDKIQREGSVYIFTSDISIDVAHADGIIVERDNIVIDGRGYTLNATGDESWSGINMTNRTGLTIKNMKITDFLIGIYFPGADNNTISGNLFANNNRGLHLIDSHYNRIVGNTIMNNEQGIHIFSSWNNSFYGNSFINNTKQYYDSIWDQPWYPDLLSVNMWDNGTTGNYWSDYNGTDNNGDGIGDTPYIIGENNQDNYPLMNEFIIPEFPSWTPLLIMLFTVIVIMVIYKQKIHKPNYGRRMK